MYYTQQKKKKSKLKDSSKENAKSGTESIENIKKG